MDRLNQVKKYAIPILMVVLLLQMVLPVTVQASENHPQYTGIANNGHRGISIDIYSGYFTDYWKNDGYGWAAYGPQGCAWFATSRAAQRTGTRFAYIYSGQTWYNGAAQRYHLSKGQTPRPNSLACYENHVAYMEDVIGSTVVVSEGGAQSYPNNDYCVIHDRTLQQMNGGGISGKLLGYVYLNVNTPPQQPNVSFQRNQVQKLTETDGRIYTDAQANMVGQFSKTGIVLWDTRGRQIGAKEEMAHPNYSHANHLVIYYDINKELGVTLKPGTKYTYQFYTTFNNQLFHSDVMSFKTPGYSWNNPFTDVHESDFFYEPVKWASEQNITQGVTPTTFGPSHPCTRAQAVTFLWRTAGKPQSQNHRNPFTDLNPREYYMDAVLWAVEHHITQGITPTQFKPSNTCTRGQIVTFLYRAQGK